MRGIWISFWILVVCVATNAVVFVIWHNPINLIGALLCLLVLLTLPRKQHVADRIRERQHALIPKSPADNVRNCQYNLAWIRALRQNQPLMNKILHAPYYPSTEQYKESRRYWLEHTQWWRERV